MRKPIVAAAVLLLLVLGSGAAQAIVISFDPPSQSANVGDTISVAVNISGLGDGVAPSLGAYDLDILFDESVLDVTTITFVSDLDLFGLGSIADATSISGGLNVFEVSLDSAAALDDLQFAAFTLFTLTFDVISAGHSILDVSINALSDSIGDPLQADVIPGNVTAVLTVPEPSTLMLMMAGALAIGLLRRARRAPTGWQAFSRDEST